MEFLSKLKTAHTKQEFTHYLENMIPCKCAICGEEPAIYKRKLSLNMIRVLAYLYHFDKICSGLHIQRELSKIGIVATAMDYIQLKRWFFIEPALEIVDDEYVIKNGYYYLTVLGKEFYENKINVKEEVLIYKNETIKFIGKDVYCKDIIENHNVKFINILKEWKITI